MRRLTTLAIVVVLAAGLGVCSKHGAKNVYSCPDKGDGRRLQRREVGQAHRADRAAGSRWWVGNDVDDLTGGFEFELAKDLCAQLGLGGCASSTSTAVARRRARPTSSTSRWLRSRSRPTRPRTSTSPPATYTADSGDEYAALLPKGSANTKLVNAAIAKLKSNGTLDALAKKWLKTG